MVVTALVRVTMGAASWYVTRSRTVKVVFQVLEVTSLARSWVRLKVLPTVGSAVATTENSVSKRVPGAS